MSGVVGCDGHAPLEGPRTVIGVADQQFAIRIETKCGCVTQFPTAPLSAHSQAFSHSVSGIKDNCLYCLGLRRFHLMKALARAYNSFRLSSMAACRRESPGASRPFAT